MLYVSLDDWAEEIPSDDYEDTSDEYEDTSDWLIEVNRLCFRSSNQAKRKRQV